MTIPSFTWITSPSDFVALADEWDALLDELGNNNVFLRHTWLREWWQVYGSNRQLWIGVQRGPQGLEAVAPFMIQSMGLGWRQVRFLGDDQVSPNHLDLICPSDRSEVFIQIVSQQLRQAKDQWDVLDLDGLTDTSSTNKLLSSALQYSDVLCQISQSTICPYIELPDSYEAYVQSRGARTRKKIRQERRILEREHPEIKFNRVTSPAEFEKVFDHFVQLHQEYWNRKGRPGSFARPGFEAFHRAVAQAMLAKGHLWLSYLETAKDILVVEYGYQFGSKLMYYNSGVNSHWLDYSIGSVMLGYYIERAIEVGIKECDLLRGEENYKLHFATGQRLNWRMQAASPTTRGQVAASLLRSETYLRALAKQAAPAGLRRLIKRWRP